MSRRRVNRYRLALTPAGAGVLTLCFPGLLVSAASGQRPLMAVSLGAALVLAANAVWALVALRSFTVTVLAPATVTVGTVVTLTVTVSGAHRLEGALGVRGGVRRWVPAQMPGQGEVLWRPPVRGVVERITVRLQSSIPLGLAAVVREVGVTPPVPVHAAPAAEPVVVGPVPPSEFWSDGTVGASRVGDGATSDGPAGSGAGAGPGDPVGLRAYAAGDPGRDVHWPTLARTGRLMVRERPPVTGAPLDVTVVVRAAGPGQLDLVAGRARAAVEQLVQAGYRVRLDSVEDGVGRTGIVHGRDDLIVRLARLGDGGPDTGDRSPLEPGPAARTPGARLSVDENGFRWRSPA